MRFFFQHSIEFETLGLDDKMFSSYNVWRTFQFKTDTRMSAQVTIEIMFGVM